MELISEQQSINCKGRLILLDKPIVMGILNATPDSFYNKGSKSSAVQLLETAEQMIADGATILDIGGMSTRPGSAAISIDEECDRVVPAIQKIRAAFPEVLISIDTYNSAVAQAAVPAGADIINDISAGDLDSNMLDTVASLQVPYIAMHMQGTPQTMQVHPSYQNVVEEVLDYFVKKLEACYTAGIKDVILDPGFGFGKNLDHNYQLLQQLELLAIAGNPVLVGFSRKSMINQLLGTTPDTALNGTTVLNTIALQKGAKILRVHDVKEAKQAIDIFQFMRTCAL
jgi:dihydropteroate synthase